MACNCTTTAQLEALYKAFDEKREINLKDKPLPYKVNVWLSKAGVTLTMVFVTPLLFLYLVYKMLFSDGKVSLKKFFNLRENVLSNIQYDGNQQDLQD